MAGLDGVRKLQLRRELEAVVGRGAVLSDPEELLVYESDGLTLFRALADFVVFPTSADHVSACLSIRNLPRTRDRQTNAFDASTVDEFGGIKPCRH